MSRIVKWLLFGVVCSLLPLLFEVLRHKTRGLSFNLVDIIGAGELLLVSTAIAATGLGELMTDRSQHVGKLLTGFSSFAITAFSAFWFADISTAQNTNQNFVHDGSLLLLSCSILNTFICFKQTESSWTTS